MQQSQETSPREQGLWPWLLQRLSAVALILLLGVHIWVTHFADIGKVAAGHQEELVLFSLVRMRLQTLVFLLVDGALLGLALFHGLNGLRTVLLEWHPLSDQERWITRGLWAVGLVAFGYGLRALWAFLE